MRKIVCALLAALCLLYLLCGCQGGADGSPPPTGPVNAVEGSLLDGRLLVDMPEGTVRYPIQQSQARPEEPAQVAMQFVYASGEEMLNLTAWELFQTSGGSLVDDARKGMDKNTGAADQYDYQQIQTGAALTVVEIIPREFDATADMVFVRGALVKDADGALMTVTLYANQELLKKRDDCIAQADAIIRSLRPGNRQLVTAAHREQDEEFSIQLEDGYVMTKQYGDTFVVYTITKMAPAGMDPPYMCVYFGSSPNPIQRAWGIDKSDLQEKQDTLLGQTLSWDTYTPKADDSTYMFRETVIDLEDDTVIHIAMIPYNFGEAELDAMTRMAGSIELAAS